MEKSRMKSYMLLITFTAALLVVVLNVSSALGLLGRLWQELSPPASLPLWQMCP